MRNFKKAGNKLRKINFPTIKFTFLIAIKFRLNRISALFWKTCSLFIKQKEVFAHAGQA